MTTMRHATCQCGQLRVATTGEPQRVTICHCEACQRRTGSVFGVQAMFSAAQVEVTGHFHDYARVSDEADAAEHVFHFCPECGSQVFQSEPAEPDLLVVAVGAFADSSFPAPTDQQYAGRRHPWVGLPGSVRDAAEIEAEVRRLYNAACEASVAGRPGDAVAHLREAIELWAGCREMAKGDDDFDPIRDEPAFIALIGA